MPFDGIDVPEAARVIDALLDFFGPEGERWIQGQQWDRKGNRCLWGAVRSAKIRRGLKDKVARLIAGEIIRHHCALLRTEPTPEVIFSYNDTIAEEYKDVRELLIAVREEILIAPSQLELAV